MRILKNGKSSICFCLVGLFLLIGQSAMWAQAIDFFSSLGNKSKRPSNAVTTIESDTMDIEINNNKATFTGEVVIDDHEIKIECDKMIVYLVDDKKEKGGKRITKIECLGNVVMNRKLYDKKDQEQGAQKAKAGKVLYDVDTGDITFTENPELLRGADMIKGDVIKFNRETNALKVIHKKGRSKIILKSGGGSAFGSGKKDDQKE